MNKILMCCLCLFFSTSIFADTLITDNYTINIEVNCEEGEVSCSDVIYIGTSHQSGKQISLIGKTQHSLCADGVTPCSFQGYSFDNQSVNYFVSVFGDLIVSTRDGRVILSESGEWQ